MSFNVSKYQAKYFKLYIILISLAYTLAQHTKEGISKQEKLDKITQNCINLIMDIYNSIEIFELNELNFNPAKLLTIYKIKISKILLDKDDILIKIHREKIGYNFQLNFTIQQLKAKIETNIKNADIIIKKLKINLIMNFDSKLRKNYIQKFYIGIEDLDLDMWLLGGIVKRFVDLEFINQQLKDQSHFIAILLNQQFSQIQEQIYGFFQKKLSQLTKLNVFDSLKQWANDKCQINEVAKLLKIDLFELLQKNKEKEEL